MTNTMNASALHVGWASVSITPDKPVQLQGQFYERISESVHDPVTATALAIAGDPSGEQGDHAVLVSCDLANIPDAIHQRIQAEIASRLPAVDARKVFLACTHTHTAPVMVPGYYPDPPDGVMHPEDYTDFLVERIVSVVEEAWGSLEPAGVSWALGHAAVGFNRRVVFEDGEAVMYADSNTPRFRSLEGTQDHGVEMLFLWDADDQLTGIVINPACPSQVVENKLLVSADYWSAARDRLRATYGADLYVLPLCSAAGDQSPRDLVRRGRGEPNMRDWVGLEEMGRRIARAVDYVYERAKEDVRHDLPFAHHVEDLALPALRLTEQHAQEARQGLVDLEERAEPGRTDRILKLRYERLLDQYEQQADEPTFPMQLHVIRLGDVAFTTSPFELFLDYGLRIKARSRAQQTFVVQLAAGRGGYLPTAKAIAGGGYGATATNGRVGPEGGDALVERSLELLNGFWD